MKIKLNRNKNNPTRRGRYIDKTIAKKLIERGREKRSLKEEKDFKAIIQKYKDTPKENRPVIYRKAVLEYAKIQLESGLTEFAIYLLEDINEEKELARVYYEYIQNLREREKKEDATEIEKKLEQICIKYKDDSNITNLLINLYIRQGKIEVAEKELLNKSFVELLKIVYFKETFQKGEAISKGENEKLDSISRQEYFENLDEEVKISNGIDMFTGYKMYEYPRRGICLIDKVFNENGITYIFPQNITFDLAQVSRTEIMKLINENKSIQKQEHKDGYYNLIQEKMKRAELEGLVIEEKKLKKLFSEKGE